MKRTIIILVIMCCYCSAVPDELIDKYFDIELDWFSNKRKSNSQVDKIKSLAKRTTDPYDKAALEDLTFLHGDRLYKGNDYIFLSYFVRGPIWHLWPRRDSIQSAFESNKPIMDIDLVCEMAFSARDMGVADGLFSHLDSEEVLMQKVDVISKRVLLRKEYLKDRHASDTADAKVIDYMRTNLYAFRRIFRAAERESAMVITLNPSFKMRKFIWVVNLLGGSIKGLTSPDYMVSWSEFYEIEDWFWINEHKIDSEMIEEALKLYSKLCLPLYEFDLDRYDEMISEESYKEIVRQTAEAGIVPLRDCRLK